MKKRYVVALEREVRVAAIVEVIADDENDARCLASMVDDDEWRETAVISERVKYVKHLP